MHEEWSGLCSHRLFLSAVIGSKTGCTGDQRCMYVKENMRHVCAHVQLTVHAWCMPLPCRFMQGGRGV